MTETLIRDEPHDTGEIRLREPGTTTTNLLPYIDLPPALRRPDAATYAPLYVPTGGCRTVVPNDEDFTTAPAEPPKLPPPPPPPTKVDDRPLSEGEEIIWDRADRIPTLDEVLAERQWQPKSRTPGYRPRHRARARWWGPLVDGIAIGWDVCRRSM